MGGYRKPLPQYTRCVAENIRSVRNYYHLTQKQFGKRICVNASTVCWWETNRSVPSSVDVVRICYEFGVSADSLLGVPREWRKIK